MQRQTAGFTLVELLMAMAIVGILMAIAVPQYQQYLKKGERAQAQGDLLEATQRLERYRMVQGSYNNAGAGSTATIPSQSPATGTAKYTIGFWNGTAVVNTTPSSTSYTLYAVRTDNSEVFAINDLGQKCYASGATTCNLTSGPRWEDAH